MALSDKQRIAVMAKAIHDQRNGEPLPTPNQIRSAEDIERLLANMGLPFQTLFEAAQQANERIAALGDQSTPEMRRAVIDQVYAAAAPAPSKRQCEGTHIVPDPAKRTNIDEHGQRYWFGTGYHGRSIKFYSEPWKFRTTVWDIVGQAIFLGLVVLGILGTIFEIL